LPRIPINLPDGACRGQRRVSSEVLSDIANEAWPADRPLVSMLLIAYNQQDVVADAVRGALAQTWQPLEILISDDCSTDRTFDVIRAAVAGYTGPHRIVVSRNPANLGISGHLSLLARRSHGELLVVTAGDDISVPRRCERLVQAWQAHGCRHDLIASDLVSLGTGGGVAGADLIAPTDLGQYHTFDNWLRARPHVVGAAHAWSRRLFERFGDMQPGAMAEDQIMTFRAIVSGGALSLREPLVQYRPGGLSAKRRWRTVDAFVARIRQTNRFALVEVAQLQHDADLAGLGEPMRRALAPKLAREHYTRAMFDAGTMTDRLRLLGGARGVKVGLRIRMFLYAAFPWVYAPVFAVKRWLRPRH
jgi:hypothetical protein